MRIVYVEDNFPNQSLVERIANAGQHEVFTYLKAEDALDNFEYDQPQMLLVDVALAGPMTGLEMVRHIRSAGYDLPIIALTSVSSEQECLEAGCNAYFVKPIRVQQLLETIQHYT